MARGNTLRAERAILADMAILPETTLLEELTAPQGTMPEEVMGQRATIAGSQAISDPIVFSRNERCKRRTAFA
jgi:hypothetical protein